MLLGANTVTTEDFDRFWAAKALWHPELESVKASTARKLRTNLFLAMREAGFLTSDGVVVVPLLTSKVVDFLQARTPNQVDWFPVPNGTYSSGGRP